MKALATEGYGLYNEQLIPYEEIIENLINGVLGNGNDRK